MTDPDLSDDQRYLEIFELAERVVLAFYIETKRKGARNSGAIGMSGRRVFDTLAKKPGVFVGSHRCDTPSW